MIQLSREIAIKIHCVFFHTRWLSNFVQDVHVLRIYTPQTATKGTVFSRLNLKFSKICTFLRLFVNTYSGRQVKRRTRPFKNVKKRSRNTLKRIRSMYGKGQKRYQQISFCEHRIVYSVTGDIINVYSLKGYY
jgi:hypothetical protein